MNLNIILRSLKKDKAFTLINILGFAVGLAVCLLIVCYVLDELSYDRYNTRAGRIFRVNSDIQFGGAASSFAITAPPVAAALQQTFPEVENAVRLTPAANISCKKGDEIVREGRIAYTDPSIFEIFTLPMIEGDPKAALTAPNALVITESTARKYFNRTHVIGQTIRFVNDSSVHTITGVIRDIPEQSHFHFDIFLPMSQLAVSKSGDWSSINFSTYILLRSNTDEKKLEVKLSPFIKKSLAAVNFDLGAFEKAGNYYHLNLTSLTDIHLRSNRQRELGPNGSIAYVRIFLAIALLILFMASINFMNLSTARSANRAREVGVHKVLGASRARLIARFLFESILLTFVAALLAPLLAGAVLPLFNQFSDKHLAISPDGLIWLLPSIIAGALIIGALAGSYPAFYLSGFQPIRVLKSKIAGGFKGSGLRNILVVCQFSISIFLMISTLVVYHQLRYIQNKDLGFNRSQVLIVKNVSDLPDAEIFKKEIKQLPEVNNATLSSFYPTGGVDWIRSFITGAGMAVQTHCWAIDDEYLKTMGMTLEKGRSFSARLATDSSAMIINETAAKMMGFFKDPLGRILDGGNDKYHVIGVVKDFNFSSLRDNIAPLVMITGDKLPNGLGIRVRSDNLSALVARVGDKWRQLFPQQQFDYSFMDDDFNTLYRTEQRMGSLFLIFSFLAIGIAFLGLFGLAAYAAEQRTKEISIRKVLGADISTLVAMLSTDFIRLVILAILIASPLAWIIMHRWLRDFAYRSRIEWWMLALSSLAAVVIALITVSIQSLKAAYANPIDSLRSE